MPATATIFRQEPPRAINSVTFDLDRTSQVIKLGTSCSGCAMRNVCMPIGLTPDEAKRLELCVSQRRRLRAGQHLYRTGEKSATLCAVRTGFVKTVVVTDDGREQVIGFHMMGEMLGTESMGGRARTSDAVALEDTEVCEFSFELMEALVRELPPVRRKLYSIMDAEIQRERGIMLLLGTLRAEERLASFLLNLGKRYESRGFSASRFVLRMSRAEIGSYLGLRLETVSRLFSRFQKEGLLRVSNKSVEILDVDAIRTMIGSSLN